MSRRCTCGPAARGTCPHRIECPSCHAGPGRRCKRPSGHPCRMHGERYRKAERDDAAACPGFEPLGGGCRHCSGLPEDHRALNLAVPATIHSRPAQPLLF